MVRLRSSLAGEPGSGMTVGVFVPAELIDRPGVPGWPGPEDRATHPEAAPTPHEFGVPVPLHSDAGRHRGGMAQDEELSLPRRDSGASGIVGVPEEPAAEAAPAVGDVPARSRPPSSPLGDTDVIFQSMVSEWLIDPQELMQPFQSWESVWDSGWQAAAQAEEVPVDQRTEHGLPVREPGARLVPGSAEPAAGGRPNGAHRKPDDDLASSAEQPRDPNAVRASLSSHWSGVRAARRHAREDQPENDK
jgi:hypothetical protein